MLAGAWGQCLQGKDVLGRSDGDFLVLFGLGAGTEGTALFIRVGLQENGPGRWFDDSGGTYSGGDARENLGDAIVGGAAGAAGRMSAAGVLARAGEEGGRAVVQEVVVVSLPPLDLFPLRPFPRVARAR